MEEKCCICGCDLPNRYALAGRCEQEGCDKAFCSLHWNRSNHMCREHGYGEIERNSETVRDDECQQEKARKPMNEEKTNPKKSRDLMKDALGKIKKLGVGAGGLLAKLKKDKSPEAMRARMDEAREKNQQLRKEVSRSTEKLHNEIVAKKKEYKSASPARKRVLEAELKARMSEYKSAEQRLKTLLENERQLSVVVGRMDEAIAYGMSSLDLDFVEDVTDDIEVAVIEFDDRGDAIRDLEKAGRPRERESDHEDFLSKLDDFDGEISIEPEEDESAGVATESEGIPEEPAKEFKVPESGWPLKSEE